MPVTRQGWQYLGSTPLHWLYPSALACSHRHGAPLCQLVLQFQVLLNTLLPCRCAGTKVLLSHYKHCTSAEGCLLCDPVRSLTTGEHAVAGLPWPLPGAAAAASAVAEERTPASPMPSTRCGAALHCCRCECTVF